MILLCYYCSYTLKWNKQTSFKARKDTTIKLTPCNGVRVYAVRGHQYVMNISDVIVNKRKRSVDYPYQCLILSFQSHLHTCISVACSPRARMWASRSTNLWSFVNIYFPWRQKHRRWSHKYCRLNHNHGISPCAHLSNHPQTNNAHTTLFFKIISRSSFVSIPCILNIIWFVQILSYDSDLIICYSFYLMSRTTYVVSWINYIILY